MSTLRILINTTDENIRLYDDSPELSAYIDEAGIELLDEYDSYINVEYESGGHHISVLPLGEYAYQYEWPLVFSIRGIFDAFSETIADAIEYALSQTEV